MSWTPIAPVWFATQTLKRSSNAAARSAVLPSRDEPMTTLRDASISPILSARSSPRQSPYAHAIMEPVLSVREGSRLPHSSNTPSNGSPSLPGPSDEICL